MPYFPPSGAAAYQAPGMASGNWYSAPVGGDTDISSVSNVAYFSRIDAPAGSFDRIGQFVSSGSTATRLAIYADDGAGKPGVLLLDAGSTAVTGPAQMSVTISLAVGSSQPLWLAVVTQGGSNNIQSLSDGGPGAPNTSGNLGVGGGWATTTGSVSGAFPANANTLTLTAAKAPRTGIRRV